MEIKIPDLGDADEVEVIELCVAVGDSVGPDDPLIVIESEKASMEVPAGASGQIESIAVAVGDNVAAGDLVATLTAANDAAEAPLEKSAADADAVEREVAETESETDTRTKMAETDTRTIAAETDTQTKADTQTEPDTPVSATQVGSESLENAVDASATSRDIEVCVPDVGDADGVEVVEVSVAVGDQIAAGDLLVILESDKASMEVPSDNSGEIIGVHVSVGDQVGQDTLLVTLRVQSEALDSTAGPQGQSNDAVLSTRQPASEADTRIGATSPDKPTANEMDTRAENVSSAKVYAGPAVRRLARELGVDLGQVTGTGNNGRLVKEDVKAFVKRRMSKSSDTESGIPNIPELDYAKFGPISTQALGKVREIGAQNLHRSWLNVVHVTQHDEANVTDLEDFRKSLKAQGEAKGIKVTPLAFIIKACCVALREFPTFNSSLDGSVQNFILKHYYHIGFAVDTPQGLVVPVIKNADQLGIWELSVEILDKAQKARDRKLAMDDMRGGTFSVSSLGAIGGTGFTPIVNAPEVAILGVGRMAMRPWWNGSEFAPAKMLPLSLSYDHRAINGAEAGRFVQRLTQLLGDVRQLVL